MKHFSYVCVEYGQGAKVRLWGKTASQLARYCNHLWFNLHCKDLDITLTSLKLRTTVKSGQAEDIIKHVEIALQREKIHLTHHCIIYLAKKFRNLNLTFKCHCQDNGGNDQETYAKAHVHVHRAMEAAVSKSKQCQINKLERLKSKLQQKDKTNPKSGPIHNIAKEVGEGLVTIQTYTS